MKYCMHYVYWGTCAPWVQNIIRSTGKFQWWAQVSWIQLCQSLYDNVTMCILAMLQIFDTSQHKNHCKLIDIFEILIRPLTSKTWPKIWPMKCKGPMEMANNRSPSQHLNQNETRAHRLHLLESSPFLVMSTSDPLVVLRLLGTPELCNKTTPLHHTEVGNSGSINTYKRHLQKGSDSSGAGVIQ